MPLSSVKDFCLFLLLLPLASISQTNPYNDKISTIVASKTDGQSVLVTGKIMEWKKENRFVLEDETGSIQVKYVNELKEISLNDEILISGKIGLDDNGRKEIRLETYRKLKFVKDPSNCCKPEID